LRNPDSCTQNVRRSERLALHNEISSTTASAQLLPGTQSSGDTMENCTPQQTPPQHPVTAPARVVPAKARGTLTDRKKATLHSSAPQKQKLFHEWSIQQHNQAHTSITTSKAPPHPPGMKQVMPPRGARLVDTTSRLKDTTETEQEIQRRHRSPCPLAA
jgi:hypothetical protein